MALPTSYLSSTKNLKEVFAAMQKAGVPETFTYEFLKQLGFASSSDRPIIPVMKALGLLDTGGRPTERYREYKDPSMGGAVIAQALRGAYADVFAIDTEAHRRSHSELVGLFSRLSDKGDAVVQKMASTFKILSEMADWEAGIRATGNVMDGAGGTPSDDAIEEPRLPETYRGGISLRHDIHVHLPLSTDIAVYDAIFMSLRKKLL